MSEAAGEQQQHASRAVAEVRELRNAVTMLASRTESLSKDFAKVNELTARQQEVDRKTAEAVAEAAKAVAAVRAVEARVVPRKEFEEREAVVRAAITAYRKRIVARWTATIVIAVALIIGGIIFAANWASGYTGAVYRVCTQRDAQSVKVRHYLEDQRANALARATDQAQRDAIIRSIKQLEDAFPVVSCRGLH